MKAKDFDTSDFVAVISEGQRHTIKPLDPANRSVIFEYWKAVEHLLKTNSPDALKDFEGKSVTGYRVRPRSIEKKAEEFTLETRLNTVYGVTADPRDFLPDPEKYPEIEDIDPERY